MNNAGDQVAFFVSRAGADKGIAQTIASILETEGGYSVILQDWDFGHANFVAKMDDALARSQRVITLLSHAYLESPSCGHEWQAVFAKDPKNFDQHLVLLRVDNCEPTGILCTLAYTDLVPVLAQRQVLRDVLLARVKSGRTLAAPDAAAAYQKDARPLRHPDLRDIWNFTGREAELAQIDEAFKTGATQFAVYGLAGVGKSTLAREFAWRRQDSHAGVWIVNGASVEAVEANLIELGQHFISDLDQVQNRAEAARVTLDRVLPSFGRPWLLIYDNLESEALLRQWAPKENALVLATSRVQTFSSAVRKVLIDRWPRTDSIHYLRHESGRDDLEEQDIDAIAGDVGDLPLPLAHAAAYLRENPVVTAASYRAHLAQHLGRVPPGFEGHPSVFATYQAAIEAVDTRHAGAAMLMRVAAWLGPDGIPRELFTQAADRYHEPLATLAADDLPLDETFSALARSSLIRYSTETRSFSVHRLVQTSARNLDGRTELYTALRVLTAAFPNGEFGTWSQCERLILHAIAVITAIGPDANGGVVTPILCARLCNNAAAYLSQRAAYASAESLLQAALSLHLQTAARGSPEVATILSTLAGLLQATNRAADAEPLYRRALEIDEASYGPDHPVVATALNNLAVFLSGINRASEAEPLLRRALAIWETSSGDVDPNVVRSLNNLALVLYSENRTDEAEALYRRALNVLERIKDADDQTLAAVLNNLGGALRAADRVSEAEPLFRRAVVILLRCAAATGDEHPKLRATIKNLIGAYEASGNRGDELLEQLSRTAADAGLDQDQIVELLEWWQDG